MTNLFKILRPSARVVCLQRRKFSYCSASTIFECFRPIFLLIEIFFAALDHFSYVKFAIVRDIYKIEMQAYRVLFYFAHNGFNPSFYMDTRRL